VISPVAVNNPFADKADDAVPDRDGARFFVPNDGKYIVGDRFARSALAAATAPALRPWRGFMVAGGLHVGLVAVVLLLIRVHLPAPPPDGPVISVEVETPPQGNTTPVNQVHAAAPVPAPTPPVTPLAAAAVMPVQQPLRAPVIKQFRSLPPVPAHGSSVAGHKIGNMIIEATRPASPDAGSTVYYSEIARELGEQGEVRLRIEISPAGKPDRVTMEKSSGYARLDEDARNSVLTWHFQPALKHGVPVESVLDYWVRFELR
jgi:periplasmic protein TonB